MISIHQAQEGKDSNVIVFATLNAVYYVINHRTKELIQRFEEHPFKETPSICFFMKPFNFFDFENNAFLISVEGDFVKMVDLKRQQSVNI